VLVIATCVHADHEPPRAEQAVRRRAAVQEAQNFVRQRDWAKAAAAYAQIVAANPYEGQHWLNYGLALHSLQRYDDAIKAWTKSIELGFRPETGCYNLACANSLAGRKDEAVAWLQKAIDTGFTSEETIRADSDLDPIRADPRVQRILGTPPAGLSREQRWRFDLDHLVRRMEKVHYNLYARVSREKFQECVTELKGRIAALKDEEVAVGIQRILALIGDGHTVSIWRAQDDKPLLRYPLELYLYKEGLYIRAASADYGDIVGSKVLKIGRASTEQALAAVEPLCSRDNAMGVKYQSPIFLTNPAVLSYLKITDDMRRVVLVIKKPTGQEAAVELPPVRITRSAMKQFVKANGHALAPEPVSFKQNDNPFWFDYLSGRRLVYFQFNAVADRPDETLEKFCDRLFKLIDEKPVETLIIDMRNNGGGNSLLNRPLVHGLIRSDRVNRIGHLFVLVGRRTFSAAMNGAVDIERHTKAIFVGEPTGSSPNFVGETTILQLPCSGLRVSCSSLYWQSSLPMDRRTWIAPELVAEPSIEAFASNRDPGLDAIFQYLDSQPEQPLQEEAGKVGQGNKPANPVATTDAEERNAASKAEARSANNPAARKPKASTNLSSLRQIVEECNRKVVEDFKKGDMLAVAHSYSDDATIYFPPGKKVCGREEIDQYWQRVKGAKDWKLETIEVGGTPEVIWEIGKSSLTTEVDGKERTYVCDYIVIWKRQQDGTYRTYADIFN
jgi:ketosteroid isomerase-like protein/tetratricopeptide (TPR) repeat protein